jgi:hypothetical protein
MAMPLLDADSTGGPIFPARRVSPSRLPRHAKTFFFDDCIALILKTLYAVLVAGAQELRHLSALLRRISCVFICACLRISVEAPRRKTCSRINLPITLLKILQNVNSCRIKKSKVQMNCA